MDFNPDEYINQYGGGSQTSAPPPTSSFNPDAYIGQYSNSTSTPQPSSSSQTQPASSDWFGGLMKGVGDGFNTINHVASNFINPIKIASNLGGLVTGRSGDQVIQQQAQSMPEWMRQPYTNLATTAIPATTLSEAGLNTAYAGLTDIGKLGNSASQYVQGKGFDTSNLVNPFQAGVQTVAGNGGGYGLGSDMGWKGPLEQVGNFAGNLADPVQNMIGDSELKLTGHLLGFGKTADKVGNALSEVPISDHVPLGDTSAIRHTALGDANPAEISNFNPDKYIATGDGSIPTSVPQVVKEPMYTHDLPKEATMSNAQDIPIQATKDPQFVHDPHANDMAYQTPQEAQQTVSKIGDGIQTAETIPANDMKQPTTSNSPFIQEMQDLKSKTANEPVLPAKIGPDVSQIQDVHDVLNTSLADRRFGNAGEAGIWNGIKNFPEDLQKTFKDWIGSRQGETISSQGQVFKESITKDLQGITHANINNFQAGVKDAYTQKLTDIAQKMAQMDESAGVKHGTIENYFPQMYAQSNTQVADALNKLQAKLGSIPGYAKQRSFDSYKQAQEIGGLTPKYADPTDALRARFETGLKAQADQTFWNKITASGYAYPKSLAPDVGGHGVTPKALDPNLVPNLNTRVADGVHAGTFYAHPAVKDLIENVLKSPSTKGIGAMYDKAKGGITGMIMASGIPYTGMNVHTLTNILPRLITNGAIKDFPQIGAMLASPKHAAQYIKNNIGDMARFTKAGMTASDKSFALPKTEIAKTGIAGVAQGANKVLKGAFHDGAFDKTMPASKLLVAQSMEKRLIAAGVSPQKAESLAAQKANEAIGGLNYKMMARDPATQTALNRILFAPDWAETGIRQAGTVGRTLMHPFAPENAIGRRLIGGLAGAGVAFEGANQAMSGHPSWQNEPGHFMDLSTNQFTSDGKRVYVNPFGTSLDMLKVPLQAAQAVTGGKDALGQLTHTVANRLTPLVGDLMQLANNKDAKGQPILNKNGQPLPFDKGIGPWLGSTILPAPVSNGLNAVTGKTSLQEATGNTLGLPLRYTGGASNDTKLQQANRMQKSGLSGSQINNNLQKGQLPKQFASPKKATVPKPKVIKK